MAKILVVDDNEFVREANRQVLENHGHQVVTAENGEEALDKFKQASQEGQKNFDVVLTDNKMPGMDGVNLAQAIHLLREQTPVILMTGMMENFEGVNAVLPKPSENRLLVGIVEALSTKS